MKLIKWDYQNLCEEEIRNVKRGYDGKGEGAAYLKTLSQSAFLSVKPLIPKKPEIAEAWLAFPAQMAASAWNHEQKQQHQQ